jgi:hypothetical protein
MIRDDYPFVRIPNPDLDFLPIPDPGSRSATLLLTHKKVKTTSPISNILSFEILTRSFHDD